MSKKSDLISIVLHWMHMRGVCNSGEGEDCDAKIIIAKFLGFSSVDGMYSNYEKIDIGNWTTWLGRLQSMDSQA